MPKNQSNSIHNDFANIKAKLKTPEIHNRKTQSKVDGLTITKAELNAKMQSMQRVVTTHHLGYHGQQIK